MPARAQSANQRPLRAESHRQEIKGAKRQDNGGASRQIDVIREQKATERTSKSNENSH